MSDPIMYSKRRKKVIRASSRYLNTRSELGSPIMVSRQKTLLLLLGTALVVAVLLAAGSIAAVIYIAKNLVPGLPTPAGPPRVVHTFGPDDEPISQDAQWVGSELEVTAAGAGVTRLFEVPLERLDQSMITYRFRVQTDSATASLYPEMWCRVEGAGEFFSRGLDQKVRGTNNWVSAQIPFYLQKGQHAGLVRLNLVFEGPAKARLTDIEVLATPLEAKAP